MVLLASGFFIRSINSAKASPLQTTQGGKYGMLLVSVNGGILVWNTATGESKLFSGAYNVEPPYGF